MAMDDRAWTFDDAWTDGAYFGALMMLALLTFAAGGVWLFGSLPHLCG